MPRSFHSNGSAQYLNRNVLQKTHRAKYRTPNPSNNQRRGILLKRQVNHINTPIPKDHHIRFRGLYNVWRDLDEFKYGQPDLLPGCFFDLGPVAESDEEPIEY